MRTIKLELTIEVPSKYKIDEGMTDFAQVCDLLDEMEDRYSNVGLIEGRIIGEQNDGKEGEVKHWKPSEEQMEALGSAINYLTEHTCTPGNPLLISLHHELQKYFSL